MQNARLDASQERIKISQRIINTSDMQVIPL